MSSRVRTVVKVVAAKALWGTLLLVSLLVSYVGTGIWQRQRQPAVAFGTRPTVNDVPPENPFASTHGTNLIGFVITASDCGWSTQPSAVKAIRALRQKLRSVHGERYAQVSLIGVALDADLDAGLRFLSELGNGSPASAFDQIAVGGSWLNEQIVRFAWRDRVAAATSPQVIMIERPIDTSAYMDKSVINVGSDKVVANPRGGKELVEWLMNNAPLDGDRSISLNRQIPSRRTPVVDGRLGPS